MSRYIVTTTVNRPTKALRKYASFEDWNVLIVGDRKTPHELYRALEQQHPNVRYLDPDWQDRTYPALSAAIGWNKIQRRTIGYLEAYVQGAEIVASVDDDNIPLDNWGHDIVIGKQVDVYYYATEERAFDPISATNYPQLWHRGFPPQLLRGRSKVRVLRRTVIPTVQACFWNGDPDIDAFCRMEHAPCCFFDSSRFPIASNALSPFNQQNTFIARCVLPHYLALPFVGRMDDIWPSYYCQLMGAVVVYTAPTVFQERNPQSLTTNLKDEFGGYTMTEQMLRILVAGEPEQMLDLIPVEAAACWREYRLAIERADEERLKAGTSTTTPDEVRLPAPASAVADA